MKRIATVANLSLLMLACGEADRVCPKVKEPQSDTIAPMLGFVGKAVELRLGGTMCIHLPLPQVSVEVVVEGPRGTLFQAEVSDQELTQQHFGTTIRFTPTTSGLYFVQATFGSLGKVNTTMLVAEDHSDAGTREERLRPDLCEWPAVLEPRGMLCYHSQRSEVSLHRDGVVAPTWSSPVPSYAVRNDELWIAQRTSFAHYRLTPDAGPELLASVDAGFFIATVAAAEQGRAVALGQFPGEGGVFASVDGGLEITQAMEPPVLAVGVLRVDQGTLWWAGADRLCRVPLDGGEKLCELSAIGLDDDGPWTLSKTLLAHVPNGVNPGGHLDFDAT